jgi:outer membrane protein TolC
VLAFRQSVLVALGEVSDALVKIDQLEQQKLLAAERLSVLQQAIRDASLLYQNGMATYLEVIVAQGNILQSELELATLKKEKLDAIADLYKSVGGGRL